MGREKKQAPPGGRGGRWPLHPAAAFVLFLLAVTALQSASDALKSTFGGASDEPAHYVTSLLVHDYLRQGLPAPPLRFARDYYLHYPQVAMGHWPPLYYAMAGVWMLLAGDSRLSLLILAGVFNAALALLIFIWGQRCLGPVSAFCAGLTAVLLPFLQSNASLVMLDVPAAFAAAVSFWLLSRAIGQDSLPWFLAWGASLAVALMTKYNPVWLCAVGPAAMLALRRWRWPFSARLWAPAAVTAALCLPFYYWARDLMKIAMVTAQAAPRPHLIVDLWMLEQSWLDLLGWTFFLLAAGGWLLRFWIPLLTGSLAPVWAVAGSALAVCIAFHQAIPTFIEPRQYLVALAPALLLAWSMVPGAAALLRRWSVRSRWSEWGLAAAVLAAFFTFDFGTASPAADPGAELSRRLVAACRPGDRILAVSGDAREAVLVAHIAEVDHRPNLSVIRASKLVARSPWTFRRQMKSSPLRFASPAELLAALRRLKVRYVVFLRPTSAEFDPYAGFVRQSIETGPAGAFQRRDLAPDHGDEVWELPAGGANGPESPAELELRFENGLGVTLELGH